MKLSIAPFAVVFLALVPAGRVGAIQKGMQGKSDDAHLKPGQYTWEAPKESKGAVDIVIHLGAQTRSVYQDGLPTWQAVYDCRSMITNFRNNLGR